MAKSHPTWVRGLKLVKSDYQPAPGEVAPYVGAWIETVSVNFSPVQLEVAPYVGAWIETLLHYQLMA